MQKHVNLVDLVKSFPTNIFLQNLASIQERTSPLNFAHLAEKSEQGSISNLSTKGQAEDVAHLLLPVGVLHLLDPRAQLPYTLDAVQRVLVESLEDLRGTNLQLRTRPTKTQV